MKTRTQRVQAVLWLIARFWLGYEWLVSGYEKVFGDGSAVWVGAKAGTAVTGFLNGAIAKSPLAPGFDAAANPHPAVQEWYAALVRDVFLPNATLMSYMVAFGELAVGLGLLVGLFTRAAALGGITLNLAFLFAGATSTNPQMLVVGMLILNLGTFAGYYGLDRYALPYLARFFQHGGGGTMPRPQPLAR